MTLFRSFCAACGAGVLALSLVACGGSDSGSDASSPPSTAGPAVSPSSSPAADMPASPAPSLDLVALIDSVAGYTYAPAPEVEQAFAAEVPEEAGTVVARGVLLDGQPQGNIIIIEQPADLTEQELRDTLAGAEAGGNETGTATRTEIAGVAAVRSVRADGGVTWSAPKGRYVVIVGALPAVADDVTTQVLKRLPG